MGVVIILIMAVGVALILSGKLPTAFALVALSVVIPLVAGAPFAGSDKSVLTAVLQDGAIGQASTMVAVILGSWLGCLMRDTAIASTLVRKTVEYGGDRPTVIALGILVVSALCGSVTGSAPAALLAGVIGIPAMVAVGVPKVTAAGTILMGIGIGMPFELPVWQFFSTALHMSTDQVRSFMILLFPFAAIAAIAYVVIETRRDTVHAWPMTTSADTDTAVSSTRTRRARLGDAPWYSLLTPLVPIVLALPLDVPIIPALLAGVLYAVITTTKPKNWNTTMLRSLYDGFNVAAPPVVLFIAIGMLLAAVGLPGPVDALTPIVKDLAPTSVWGYIIVFSVLVPLCLYRGPLNIFGLGAGIAGAMTAIGFYSPFAVLGLMTSYNQVLGIADPTSTQTVWAAQYAGVTPQRVMVRVLPYVWFVAIAGIVMSAIKYL